MGYFHQFWSNQVTKRLPERLHCPASSVQKSKPSLTMKKPAHAVLQAAVLACVVAV
jgi:hypothetical protein